MRVTFPLTLAILGMAVVLITGCESTQYMGPGGESVMIPPIDLNKPADTEQATFALG